MRNIKRIILLSACVTLLGFSVGCSDKDTVVDISTQEKTEVTVDTSKQEKTEAVDDTSKLHGTTEFE